MKLRNSKGPQIPLTDTRIRNLKLKEKPYKVSDFEGLFLMITPAGSKLWNLKYRIHGQEKKLSSGAYPAISLAQARKLKEGARALLAHDIDPGEAKQETKRAKREAMGHAFQKIGQDFYHKQVKEGKSKATLDKTAYHLKLANAEFGRKPITEITAQMILRVLRKQEAKGNYETALRLRARIGSVFRFAVASGLAETDPTHALKDALIRPSRKHRAAITDRDALGSLLRSIEAATTRLALKLLAITAQRPGEIRHAKWEEFDFQEKVWSLPASKMKMRHDHNVPLPDQAIALLHELRMITGNGELLFAPMPLIPCAPP